MPKYIQGVGANAILFSFDGVDLSSFVRSVTIAQTVEDVDVTPMNSTSRQHAAGLSDDSIEVEFFQAFGSGEVDQTIFPHVGSSTGATVIFQTSGATVNATNPKYEMVGVPFTYNPVDGEVGAASMTTVSFMPAQGSALTRGTT